ncbi:hypothetical protein [Apilactobacillus ozensis]|uniref:hypothetical protein n=1 Tax=Apilactobacillus ozensis TaxID=866801 RepID=UPI0006D0D551|nr:hypothetical protein [Apilactobacillus ozensis]
MNRYFQLLKKDLPQFGTDELFGIYIASHFTTAGIANYGYLDQTKNGIAKKIGCFTRPWQT